MLPKIEYPEVAWPPFMEKRVSVDTEYAPDTSLITVAAATPTRAAAIEETGLTTFSQSQFYNVVENAMWLIGHSIMGDVDQLVKLHLAKEAWIKGENVIDTLLCERMIDENQGKGNYSLEQVLLRYFDVEAWKSKTTAFSETDATKWPANLRQERCRLDAWASAVIADKIARTIPTALRTFTHRIAATLHRISLSGACIDQKVFERMGGEFNQRVELARHKLNVMAINKGMESFTATKDKDIGVLLYDKYKLPVTRKTKTTGARAVDQRTLQKYSHVEVVKTLLEFNKAHKLHSTWYGTPVVRIPLKRDPTKFRKIPESKRQSLKDMIAPYSRIGDAPSELGWLPFHINPLGARTGRRSSERPNSQNWPKSVRRIIVSRWDNGSIGSFDYKSLEPFVISWIAQDEKLYDYFHDLGGYVSIARDLLKKDVEKGTTDYVVIKSVFLATIYNQLPWTLAMSLDEKLGVRIETDWDTNVAACGTLLNRLLAMFPDVRRYMQARRSEVERTGQVVSPSGRIRHLPYPKLQDFNTEREWKRAKKRVENQAINYPVQSFASEVTGSAIIDCESELLKKHGLSIGDFHSKVLMKNYPKIPLLINEVHDELLFDLPDKNDVSLICDTMKAVTSLRKLVPTFDIPLDVEVNVSKAWGVINED